MKTNLILWTFFIVLVFSAPPVEAADKGPMGQAQHRMKMERPDKSSCQLQVNVSAEAEKKLGGALYTGPLPKEAMQMGEMKMQMGGMKKPMGGMKKAAVPGEKLMANAPGMKMPAKEGMDMKSMQMAGMHMAHKSQHGGNFFMAPDKMHHLEAKFSERCGFQLVFYNAYIKHIGATRFRAFIKIVPDSEHEAETLRFLSLNEDGTVLGAHIGKGATRPFTIEAYVKFPEADGPGLFTVRVPATIN